MQHPHNYIKPYHLLFIGLSMLMFSCSTTRQIERKEIQEAYQALNLPKERKDNVELYKEAASWLNVPHVERGTSHNGVDCSFLVHSIYQKVYNKKLERNSANIMQINCRRLSKNQLDEGDLVFFNTSQKGGNTINHVGIYLKEDKFLHTSTSRGVIVSDLNDAYYQKTWICGGRVK